MVNVQSIQIERKLPTACRKKKRKKKIRGGGGRSGGSAGINYANNTMDFSTWKPNFPIISTLSLNIFFPQHLLKVTVLLLIIRWLGLYPGCDCGLPSEMLKRFTPCLHSHTSNYAAGSPEIRFNYTVMVSDGH